MRRCRTQQGFTLVELTLAIVLTSIIALALAPLLATALESYAMATARSRAVHDARHAMMQMVSEMRLLTTPKIQNIQPTNFGFLDAQNIATSYTLIPGGNNGGSLMRGNTLLSPNVNTLTFTYLDANGAVTNVIANVRRIGIALTTNALGEGTIALRTEVYPRNFMYANFQ